MELRADRDLKEHAPSFISEASMRLRNLPVVTPLIKGGARPVSWSADLNPVFLPLERKTSC